MDTAALNIPTPDGDFVARYSDAGLVALDFPAGTKAPGGLGQSAREEGRPAAAKIRRWHSQAARAVRAAAAGQPCPPLPPLDWSGATDFQKAVWSALLKIPPGQVVAYGELARVIGRPNSARAVGAACGANPIPLLVPCHRVVAAHGQLGGFSAGLKWKQLLLGREAHE
jgi:O-6-methylguanine DNA methyltransferase